MSPMLPRKSWRTEKDEEKVGDKSNEQQDDTTAFLPFVHSIEVKKIPTTSLSCQVCSQHAYVLSP